MHHHGIETQSLEFIFVLESKEDPAFETLTSLIDGMKDAVRCAVDPDEGRREVKARVCLAGLATTSGQKVHK